MKSYWEETMQSLLYIHDQFLSRISTPIDRNDTTNESRIFLTRDVPWTQTGKVPLRESSPLSPPTNSRSSAPSPFPLKYPQFMSWVSIRVSRPDCKLVELGSNSFQKIPIHSNVHSSPTLQLADALVALSYNTAPDYSALLCKPEKCWGAIILLEKD